MPEPRVPCTRIGLAPAERDRLARGVGDVRGRPYGADYCDYRDQVLAARGALPTTLGARLAAMRDSAAAGVLLIDGLPDVPPLPDTPIRGFDDAIGEPVGTEALHLMVALELGEPIAFADWHRGDRVQNLYPIPSLAHVQCASNSDYLEYHTETAFRPDTPVWVTLRCLRPDPEAQAQTHLCDLCDAIADLDDWQRDLLAQPRFAFVDREGRSSQPMAIIQSSGPALRYHFAEALVGCDASAAAALRSLRPAIEAHAFSLRLETGQMLAIDNRHMVHARSKMVARYDGADRWLQRVLVA